MKKVIVGFVIQEFNDETGVCEAQDFIAEDEASWEDDFGNSINPPKHEYFPYDMTQPTIDEEDELSAK